MRTKQTPRNPNIERPVAAIGNDIQYTERKPTPRPTPGKVPSKGGKEPRKHLSKILLHLGAPPTGGIKNPIVIGLHWYLYEKSEDIKSQQSV